MDSLITAAAHALATGDPLDALKRVALRNDAPALALRGIPMAQIGDFVRVMMRRLWRFEASRWPRSATSFERRLYCEGRGAPLALKSRRTQAGALLPSLGAAR